MNSARGALLVVVLLAAGAAVAAGDGAVTAPAGTVLDGFVAGVERTVLDNGLTVLFRPQNGTGVVAINTWVKAGYFHEPDEVAGMAHLFEHMFFKGSKKFPGAEDIARELSRVGGQTNAGTIYDSTNYYVVVPSEAFERAVEIQADAVMNPLFDPAELAKEAEVVIEESNRKLDNPPAVSLERMFATSFVEHRIRRWRIGSNDVLRNIDRDDLVAFFNSLYRPENIVLSIAGDVSSEQVSRVVGATFAGLPRGRLDKHRGPAEPPQKEFRFGQSSADIRQGYSVFGWHTPGVGSDDELALDVLAQVLGAGRSSRLYREVVAPDGAATVSAMSWPIEDIGVFFVQASFDEANRAEVDRRILREVERMRRHGPTAYELELAKNVIESQLVLGLETVLGQAQALAEAEAKHGGHHALAVRLAGLERLTAGEVRDAARRYLAIDQLTLYHYRPRGVDEMSRERALEQARAAVTGDDFDAEPEIEPPVAPKPVAGAGSDPAVREARLANGVTVLVTQRTGAPVVATGVYFRGGRIGETSRNAGITELMTAVMRRGTAARSADQINREIEFLGTQIASTATSDSFGFTLDILAKNLRPGLELLADVVLRPSFPEAEIAESKAIQLASIRRSLDSATQRPFQLLFATHYGNHPYGLPSSGFSSSVGTIDRDQLTDWWSTWVRADDAVVIVAGDVAAEQAIGLVEGLFGSLPRRTSALPPVPAVTPPANRVSTFEYRDRRQSAIAVGFQTVPMSHDDWPALRLLQNVTSGLAGTFFAELRGKRSLAYTVFASEASRAADGIFVGYLASDAAKEADARQALIDEFGRLADDGFTDDDVARAKVYYAGSTRINRQTNGAQVSELGQSWVMGLGLDFTDRLGERIEAIGAARLREVAGRYLGGELYTTAVVSGVAE